MIKIGAKLVINHKTVKRYEFLSVNEYTKDSFYPALCNICEKLDIEVPIVIDYHRLSYEQFNSVKFTKDDFIDKFNYDYLFLENDDR